MTPEPSASERKLAAKRNERVKLAATLNTLAIGTLGAAIIVPSFNPSVQPDLAARGIGVSVGVGLH